jgi:hypothetical protein
MLDIATVLKLRGAQRIFRRGLEALMDGLAGDLPVRGAMRQQMQSVIAGG